MCSPSSGISRSHASLPQAASLRCLTSEDFSATCMGRGFCDATSQAWCPESLHGSTQESPASFRGRTFVRSSTRSIRQRPAESETAPCSSSSPRQDSAARRPSTRAPRHRLACCGAAHSPDEGSPRADRPTRLRSRTCTCRVCVAWASIVLSAERVPETRRPDRAAPQ